MRRLFATISVRRPLPSTICGLKLFTSACYLIVVPEPKQAPMELWNAKKFRKRGLDHESMQQRATYAAARGAFEPLDARSICCNLTYIRDFDCNWDNSRDWGSRAPVHRHVARIGAAGLAFSGGGCNAISLARAPHMHSQTREEALAPEPMFACCPTLMIRSASASASDQFSE
jgi:hypothetical protein